jgi:hypothetical protein
MKSPTMILPPAEQLDRFGIRDVELLRRYAALIDDDMPTVLTNVRRHREEIARKIADDAVPQLISDDEPTMPVNRWRGMADVAHTRPVG